MRGILLFVAGLIVGAGALYVGMWQAGIVSPPIVWVHPQYAPAATPSQTASVQPPAVSTPPPSTAPALPPPATPPAVTPSPASIPQSLPPPPDIHNAGEADRVATPTSSAPGDIVPPIANLQLSDVKDMFNEARGGGRPHQATDIMEPRGTPVRAMVDGVIKKLFVSKPGGNTIYQIDDREQYCYYYAHLDRYADGIKEGQHVTRGTVIGYVGSTGDADSGAPHLHLAISRLGPDKHWWQGTPVNPYPILVSALKQ
jgi:murein DD-endopeptidase MepM/ murein hydrolase activator NlpD